MGAPVNPWDTEFLMARARFGATNINQKKLADYTRLESVLDGFRELMEHLFGLTIKVSPMRAKYLGAGVHSGYCLPECIHGCYVTTQEIHISHTPRCPPPGVPCSSLRGLGSSDHQDDSATSRPRALGDRLPGPVQQVWDVAEGIDLYHRQGPVNQVPLYSLRHRAGKYPGAVTFPIRCGRSLGGEAYQLPILALLADFGPDLGPGQMCLSYRDLRTLLHELGHCFHSLASRTKYQHLWGTRCAQDLVEVPSHLFEHWAVDPSTLRVLAKHRSTREPIPLEAAESLVRARRTCSALELQGQVGGGGVIHWSHYV